MSLIETTILHIHKRKESTVLLSPIKRTRGCDTKKCRFLIADNVKEIAAWDMGRGVSPTKWEDNQWK